MTEAEPEDWPDVSNDKNHPFGAITVGANLCAYCAAENMDSRMSIQVKQLESGRYRLTQIFAGEHLALLAAGSWPDKFEITGAAGYRIGAVAITTIKGTALCRYHLFEELKNLR